MLVLTRKYQEKIRIGNNITITVLRMKGKAVRLGIEAPVEVPVVRGELSFHGDADTHQHEDVACGEASSNGRTFGHPAMSTPWPASPRREATDSAAKVGLSRVPRDQVANLLPRLVAGPAPFRAMMDQKSLG